MEFLKELLTEETFTKLAEELKDKDVKLANLSNGEYVSKGKFDSQSREYAEAKQLIEQLKGENKNNEDLQTKISTYETNLAKLQEENEQLKLDNAIKFELLNNKAKSNDIDYLMFKIKQENKELKLDDNGHVKIDIDALKSTYSSNFEQEATKKINVNNLPKSEENEKISKEDFNKMGYMERNKLFKENPELYNELKN